MNSYDTFLQIFLTYKISTLSRAHERHRTFAEVITKNQDFVYLQSNEMKTNLLLPKKDVFGLAQILETDEKTLVNDLKKVFKSLNVFVYVNYLIQKLDSSDLPKQKEYKIHQNGNKIYKYINFNGIKYTPTSWGDDFSFIGEFLDTKIINILSYMLIIAPFEVLTLKLEKHLSLVDDILLLNKKEQVIFLNNILGILFLCDDKNDLYMEQSFIERFDRMIMKIFNCFKISILNHFKLFVLKDGLINKYFKEIITQYSDFLTYLNLIEYKIGDYWLHFVENTAQQEFTKFIVDNINFYFLNQDVLISNILSKFDNSIINLNKINCNKLESSFKNILYQHFTTESLHITNIYIERINTTDETCFPIDDFVTFRNLTIKFIKMKDNNNTKIFKDFEDKFSKVYMTFVKQLSDKFNTSLNNSLATIEVPDVVISKSLKCQEDLMDTMKMGLSFSKEIYHLIAFDALIETDIYGKKINFTSKEKEQNVIMYYKLITGYTKNIVNYLIIYMQNLNNKLVNLIYNYKFSDIEEEEEKTLSLFFLVLNNMIMCLKVSNDLKILIYGNENLELKQKVHIPNNNKNFYYQVDVVLSRKKQNDKIFVNLNGLRLFDGKNRLNVQTDLNNNNLQVTCKDLKECDIAACKLQMAHVNDRMTIIFKDKKLPRIDLRISNVIREQFDISFYIRIYKNVASSIINNTIVHYLITYFMNIKWDNIIRQTKKLELDFFMSGLLKNYFFNNLWQHICWKLYIDCEDMYNLTNKNDNSLDNTENVKFEEYIQLVSSKLDGLFLELKDIISITQIEKQNRFFDSIKDFEVNHEFIKTEIKNPNKENMDHQKFALSIYTEKKDRFIDKISPNASLDSINIFSNKPILSYTNSTTEQENTSDEENKEEAEEESFVTTSDGKFNINRKYIDKDLINFRLDGY